MKQQLWRWLAFGLAVFMLVIAISADRGTIPTFIRDIYRFPGGDWAGHFILYGMLAYICARAFPHRVLLFARRSIPLAALLVLLIAVLEELSQFWFPQRTPDWRDLGFGMLGILIATWLVLCKKQLKTT